VTVYKDADGNVTETTYDFYGRPVTVTDGKGTETLHYDEELGLVTSLEVSGVGNLHRAARQGPHSRGSPHPRSV
jgi:YD repeat-containing protein